MEELLSLKINRALIGLLVLYFIFRCLDHFLVFVPVRLYGSDEMMSFKNHFVYNYIPYLLYTVLRIFLIAAILNIGAILYNVKSEKKDDSFINIFKVVIIADGAYLLQLLYRVVYFLFISPSYSFDDYNEFSPLSLYSIFGDISPLLNGLLKGINLFELFHIIILSTGMRIVFGLRLSRAITVVISTYFMVFIFWQLIWSSIWR